jgi:hypothetical protein
MRIGRRALLNQFLDGQLECLGTTDLRLCFECGEGARCQLDGSVGGNGPMRYEQREALRFNPDYSLEHRRRVLPYKKPADFELMVEGLRKAGLTL